METLAYPAASWLESVEARKSTQVIRPSTVAFDQDPTAADAFKRAYQRLIDDGTLGRLVAIHGDMGHQQHSMRLTAGNLRFLPWHRVFLYVLESALRAIDSSVVVPYWDWTAVRAIPAWVSTFTPDVPIPAYVSRMPGHVVLRTPVAQHVRIVLRNPKDPSALPTAAMLNVVMSQSSFQPFTTPTDPDPTSGQFPPPFGLEALHNMVHNWVGCTMAGVDCGAMSMGMPMPGAFGESPADVLFWLHHANVDRIWAQWHATHDDPSQFNAGDPNAQLDPWFDAASGKFTDANTRDTALLNYSYS